MTLACVKGKGTKCITGISTSELFACSPDRGITTDTNFILKLCIYVSKRFFFLNLLLHPSCDIVAYFLIDLILIIAHDTALAQSMIRLFYFG